MNPSKIDPDDALVLFADLQAGIADLPGTVPHGRLQKGVRNLARLAAILRLPVVVSAVRGEGGADARIMTEIAAELGALPTHHRTRADSFEDEAIRRAVEATDRRTILLSGVATEIAVLLPALSFADAGYRTFVVVDAVSGMDPRTEDAALRRLLAAGGSTTSVLTLAGELAGDFTTPKAQQAVAVLFDMAGGS